MWPGTCLITINVDQKWQATSQVEVFIINASKGYDAIFTVSTYIYHANDKIQLFCLYYVFIPCINRDMHDFSEAFNNISMRKEREKSPVQLWNIGILKGIGPLIQEEIELRYSD